MSTLNSVKNQQDAHYTKNPNQTNKQIKNPHQNKKKIPLQQQPKKPP